jgi:ABC-2 type transport system ATP-binding protein
MTLHIDSVSHRFRNQAVLHDVSLTVERGDCYGLLGHNGAGKTTLLRIALGLLNPSSGRLTVDGFPSAAFPREARARLGGLIDYPCFHESWDGPRNLAVWAHLQGLDRRQCRDEAQRVLALVGLGTHSGMTEHKPVRDYSQGMKQRLGIAQALLGRPSFILLDEPMNGLDPQAIVDMRSLIRRLTRDENVAVVLSSHQLTEISGLCDRIAILREGVLLVEDAMERLLDTDKKRYRLRVACDPVHTQACFDSLGLSYRLEAGSPADSTFVMDLGAETPASLCRYLLANEIDLLALTPCDPSLEEVYLRIDAQARDGLLSQSPRAALSPSPSPGRPGLRQAPAWPLLRGMRYELVRFVYAGKMGLLWAVPALAAGMAIVLMVREAGAQAERVGQEVFSTTQITAFDGVGRGLKIGLPMLMALMAGWASQAIAGEQSKGTLRYLLLRPIRRQQIAISKFCTLVLLCLGGYVLLVLASIGVSAYCLDFKDLAELLPNGKLFPLVEREAMWELLGSVLSAPMLPLISYAGMGFAIGSWINSGVGALSTTLGAILVLDLGRAFVPYEGLCGWLPSAHLPSPLGGHSFVQYYCDMVQGVSNATQPHAALSLATPLVWLAVTVALAAWALKRKAG